MPGTRSRPLGSPYPHRALRCRPARRAGRTFRGIRSRTRAYPLALLGATFGRPGPDTAAGRRALEAGSCPCFGGALPLGRPGLVRRARASRSLEAELLATPGSAAPLPTRPDRSCGNMPFTRSRGSQQPHCVQSAPLRRLRLICRSRHCRALEDGRLPIDCVFEARSAANPRPINRAWLARETLGLDEPHSREEP